MTVTRAMASRARSGSRHCSTNSASGDRVLILSACYSGIFVGPLSGSRHRHCSPPPLGPAELRLRGRRVWLDLLRRRHDQPRAAQAPAARGRPRTRARMTDQRDGRARRGCLSLQPASEHRRPCLDAGSRRWRRACLRPTPSPSAARRPMRSRPADEDGRAGDSRNG